MGLRSTVFVNMFYSLSFLIHCLQNKHCEQGRCTSILLKLYALFYFTLHGSELELLGSESPPNKYI